MLTATVVLVLVVALVSALWLTGRAAERSAARTLRTPLRLGRGA